MLAAENPVLAEPCVKGSLLNQRLLDKQFAIDDMRIFYTLTGDDALKYPDDRDANGIPDSIENMAVQLQAARYLYSDIFGLRFPLQQPVFANAGQVNVYVYRLPKGNGAAFDKVARETMADGQQTPCGIKLAINRSLEPAKNATPAHELFHLYQYGYGVFKQGWYLEGMARWMENPFKPLGINTRYQTVTGPCAENYNLGPKAASYWASYAQNHFPAVKLPPRALAFRYKNGNPVLLNNVVPGGTLLAPFFQRLAGASVRVSGGAQRPNIHWTEQQQRDPALNGVICQTLISVPAR